MFGDYAVVSLNDVYLTRGDFQKIEKKINQKISRMNASLCFAWLCVGMLAGMAIENRLRIEDLEKKEETAG